MRKLVGLIILLVLVVGPLSAAMITVTKPAANETWIKGQTYVITWAKSGDMPNLVRISLRDKTSATEVMLIADNQPNSGSYQWLVPASATDGQYRVRVKVKNATVTDDSDVFAIAAGPSGPSIDVTKPAAGDTWNRNKNYTITWTKNGTMPASVKIDLLDAMGMIVVKPIADGVPNSGSYSWLVPADTAYGDYRVRVQVKTSQIQDTGGKFAIAAAMTAHPGQIGTTALNPYLKVINPGENSVVHNSDHLLIKFGTDQTLGTVEIQLYDEAKSHKIWEIVGQAAFGQGQEIPPVGPDSPNQYFYGWEVPYGDMFSPGYYTIKIRGFESGLVAWSPKFQITWPMKEHEYTLEGNTAHFGPSIINFLCLDDHTCLNPWPPSPFCDHNAADAFVGWYDFDYNGGCTGGGSPYWRYWVYYAQLKFPIEQFQNKTVLLLKAELQIQKVCTANLNTTLASAAHLLSKLKASPPASPTLTQFRALPRDPLFDLPSTLGAGSYDVKSTVDSWIKGWEANNGFLLSVANENFSANPSTCLSAYRVRLYIKIMEEFKGYD